MVYFKSIIYCVMRQEYRAVSVFKRYTRASVKQEYGFSSVQCACKFFKLD